MSTLLPLEMTIAFKAIALHPELNANEKRVGIAIVDHYNRRTAQCDPSAARLGSLLRLSGATIFRAIDRLDGFGLIERSTHGGKSHRNSYAPNWAKFRELDAEWSIRFTGKGAIEQEQSQACDPPLSRNCDTDDLNPATQTSTINQNKQTFSPAEQIDASAIHASGVPELAKSPDTSPDGGPRRPNKRDKMFHTTEAPVGTLSVTHEPLLRQHSATPRHSFLVSSYRSSPARSEAARERAIKRLHDDIRTFEHGKYYAELVELCGNEELHEKALSAEMRRPGNGIGVILAGWRLGRSTTSQK